MSDHAASAAAHHSITHAAATTANADAHVRNSQGNRIASAENWAASTHRTA